jgi:hypothetical protein
MKTGAAIVGVRDIAVSPTTNSSASETVGADDSFGMVRGI